MKKNRTTRGFTLAELLIVVAIIGVLVAVAIPVFSSSLEKAREATCKANRRSLLGIVSTAAMLDSSFLPDARDYDIQAVQTALAASGNSFTDEICPSAGEITVTRVVEGGGFIVTCSVHKGATTPDDTGGRTDWMTGERNASEILAQISASFTPNKNNLNDDYDFWKAFTAATNGKLQQANEAEVLSKFPEDAKLRYNRNTENGLAWTGVRVFFDGGPHDILLLTTGTNAAPTSGNPQLKGFLFYFNGQYYRTDADSPSGFSQATLYGGQNNAKLSFEDFLTQKGWVTCES